MNQQTTMMTRQRMPVEKNPFNQFNPLIYSVQGG